MVDRKKYQKEYYARRKLLTLQPYPDTVPPENNKNRSRIVFKVLFMIISSLFLTIEISQFYALTDHGQISPYVKAVLGESILFIVSSFIPRNYLERFVYSSILFSCVALSTYTFCAVSYKFYKTNGNKQETSIMSIRTLQEEIKTKQVLVEFYIKKDWPTTVNKLNQELIDLNNQLKIEIKLFKDIKSNNLYDLIALILLRILIQLTNIFLVKSMFTKTPA